MSNHTVKITIEPCSFPHADFTCHEPDDAQCRLRCKEQCEEQPLDVCRDEGHEIVRSTCNYLDWMAADGNAIDELYEGPKTEVRSGPVEFEWNGDYYTWSYATICCVCSEPITSSQRWIGHQRLGVQWHESHGIDEPICGEDISGHTLLFGGAA